MTRFSALLMLMALSGCAADIEPPCPLDSLERMNMVQLFFGTDIPGREPLTEREWSEFVASVISRELPQGFTVTDGDGEWRNPDTQAVVHEHTKVLIVAAPPSPDFASHVSHVREAYRQRYRQASVGMVTYSGCGQF
jgi:hypothetical protein